MSNKIKSNIKQITNFILLEHLHSENRTKSPLVVLTAAPSEQNVSFKNELS